jgi:hypothetical protein
VRGPDLEKRMCSRPEKNQKDNEKDIYISNKIDINNNNNNNLPK